MNILVVGCGSIGERHIRNLIDISSHNIIAFDTSNERLDVIKKRFNIVTCDDIERCFDYGIDKDAANRYGPDASWAYDMKYLGRNYRMTDFQAALGSSQLKKLDMFIEKRNGLASKYYELLGDVEYVTLPFVKDNVRHVWHLYTILLDGSIDRDEFFKYMRSANIGVNLHYIPVYRHSYYVDNFAFDPDEFPVTEDIFRRIITLPLYPKMELEQLEYVVEKIKDYQ